MTAYQNVYTVIGLLCIIKLSLMFREFDDGQ